MPGTTAISKRGKVQPVKSSLPLQLLLYCNAWYYGLFTIAEFLIFIFKATVLPYGPNVLSAEIILLLALTIIEGIRIFFGMKGNLTERNLSLVVSLVFTVVVTFGILYYILWQTYVLRLEIILCGIELAFLLLEVIFSIISMITFAQSQ